VQKLADICVRRPVFATMLVLSLSVVGGFSFLGLGVDQFPDVDFPTVGVAVINPGASPEQIETEITRKLEGAINTIGGLDEIRSSSVEGRSQVVATFDLEKDEDVAAQEVRDKVNLVIPELPTTAEAPVIQKFEPGASSMLQIAVSADRPLREVTRIADWDIKQRLESIDGVGEVRLVGGARREIQIRLDPEHLRAYDLTVNDVAGALRQQNIEMPAGRVAEGASELTVRALGRLTDPEAFAEVAVVRRGAYVVRVRDLGDVLDTQEERRSASFLNGEPAVTLVVTKQSGENTVAVAGAVKARLADLAAALPPDIRVRVIQDQSLTIQAAVEALEEHLILGSLLASIVIFFFLANVRTTLIAAVAIPTSIVSTFALMAAMDYTLNQITMLSLTLMVGIVIDDAIVVLENIYRFIEEKGMTPYRAAIEGTREIGLAVMATTLSLMAVFIPVAFMGGIVGRFMASFGLTAAFAVGVSLLVSFTLTPMLSSRFIRIQHRADRPEGGSKATPFFRPIDRSYTAMLRWSMAHRGVVVAACVLVVAAIPPLFIMTSKNFLPTDDEGAFVVSVRAPEGTSLASTVSVLDRIARDMRAMPGVTDTLVAAGEAEGVNAGSVHVQLAALEDRQRSQAQYIGDARGVLAGYPPDLRTAVRPAGGPGDGPGGGGDITYTVAGPDLDQLGRYAEALAGRLRENPTVVDIDTSLVLGKPELRIAIDRERAADRGVRVQDVARALNTLVAGEAVSTFDVGNEQYDVRLLAKEAYRTSPDALERLTVSSSREGTVPLSEVVSMERATGPSTIDHLNRERQVTVIANLTPDGSQADVLAELDEVAAGLRMPAGYTSGPAGISEELGNAAYYFALAIVLSFVFMYIVLAAQFESFLHPITILLTLPLAIPFGILSLLVTGQSINVFSGLGLLLLFGIVKKNAILQIDHMNTLREAGLERYDAIIQANRDRLRPILMTTLALIAGMMPLVLSSGAGASSNRSIGVLVVGGQALCLLLTLLAVPVFYSLFEDAKMLPARLMGRSPRASRAGPHAAVPVPAGDGRE